MGGDPVHGIGFVEALELFQADAETELIVLTGEIGGDDEERAAAIIAERVTKPVVGYLAGFEAPPGKRMGHAGAIVTGSSGTAAAKAEALEAVGASVGRNPSQVADLVAERLGVIPRPSPGRPGGSPTPGDRPAGRRGEHVRVRHPHRSRPTARRARRPPDRRVRALVVGEDRTPHRPPVAPSGCARDRGGPADPPDRGRLDDDPGAFRPDGPDDRVPVAGGARRPPRGTGGSGAIRARCRRSCGGGRRGPGGGPHGGLRDAGDPLVPLLRTSDRGGHGRHGPVGGDPGRSRRRGRRVPGGGQRPAVRGRTPRWRHGVRLGTRPARGGSLRRRDTRTDRDEVLRRRPGRPRAGGGLLFGAHVLAMPAQSALLLAPASGSCLEIVGEGSILRLCPWRLVGSGPAGGIFLPAPLELAPSLWLLSVVPGVAAMLGGRTAVVGTGVSGGRAAGVGAAAGFVFASLVVVGGWFAALRFSSVLLPGRLVCAPGMGRDRPGRAGLGRGRRRVGRVARGARLRGAGAPDADLGVVRLDRREATPGSRPPIVVARETLQGAGGIGPLPDPEERPPVAE